MMAISWTFCALSVSTVIILLTGSARSETDYQQWSVQTYEGDPYMFECSDELYPVTVTDTDHLTWRRHGEEENIVTDDHFELGTQDGVENMTLTINSTSEETIGIYFCEIHDADGNYVDRVIKALNVGGFKYHDGIDKYERNVITGVISGACVLVLVVGVCAIDRFQYRSEDERRERREAKEERLRRHRELKHGGKENLGMAEVPPHYDNGFNGTVAGDGFHNQTEINTAL